ncbi:hypothetical protein F0562_032842 [Nyssa sinensis]|uniref:Uncharacterized protein n=1 Tax=Nyssa sinensis TaxID=561372 RepID=A0A5J5ATJ2_9ASTE|nr:hypothetical protein F0562_032842 [Nyssa sinensis]
MICFALALDSMKTTKLRKDSYCPNMNKNKFNSSQILGLLMICILILSLHHFNHVRKRLQSLLVSKLQIQSPLSLIRNSQQHFDRATKLLNRFDELSSSTGNPVQRVVYYFSKAIQEKLDQATGKIGSKDFVKKQPVDLKAETITKRHPSLRSGMQWTVLMQALAARCECPVELLKITNVGTKSKPKIEETEVDANHISPVFVNRSVEALLFYGAVFDCLEDFMNQNDPNRMISESKYGFDAIENIVAAEGEGQTPCLTLLWREKHCNGREMTF